MNITKLGISLGLAAFVATPAFADYDSHPELRPENRCVNDAGLRFDQASADEDGNTPAGIDPIHCQRLFWDLPATTELGAIRVAAPFEEDPIPRFPRGVTDRIPPMYVDADGNGYEQPGPGRTPLCDDPDTVPRWLVQLDEEGTPIEGTDDQGRMAVGGEGPQTGPLAELTCTRGSRAYLGPWQVGRDTSTFDALQTEQFVRFESTDRLNRDVAEGRADAGGRFEWSVESEYYNHFSSHHGTCYMPNHTCNRYVEGRGADAYAPGGECWDGYQREAEPDGACYSADADTSCGGVPGKGAFRNATQVPGRLNVSWGGDERGTREVEDTVWDCNHHVVHQLPPGSYGMDKLADYRQQAGGLANPRIKGVNCEAEENDPETTINETRGCKIYNVDAGETFGGAVGEMIIMNFTTAAKSGTKPLNNMFNAAGDLATTFYPPFTWHYHTSLWFPPFDSYVVVGAIHSHHRMVKGTMDVIPPNPPRVNSSDANCGGAKNGVPEAMYVNWEWEDARVCEWWKQPDGPMVLRKHQAIATTCFVNNGVTPEAIKHGLVAGSVVEGLKELGAPIPDYPKMVPASTWGDALTESPVGDQLLYGTHPPINYRVVYKCARAGVGTAVVAPLLNLKPCNPNPAVDADGDYIDGPYHNEEQCGGICEPSSIVFACVGEDEMCIGVAAYYRMPTLGVDEEAQDNLLAGDVDGVGTPVNTGVQMDAAVSGDCPECDEGPGL